jgi:hypothetical protein
MTQDLKDASSKGKLNQFFNSADNASALERHNMALAKLIADSTVRLNSQCVTWVFFDSVSKLVTVNEVLRSLRKIGVSFHTMDGWMMCILSSESNSVQNCKSPLRPNVMHKSFSLLDPR